jgi:hypothetical protein
LLLNYLIISEALVMKAISHSDVALVQDVDAPGYVVGDYIGSHAVKQSETGFQAFVVKQTEPELRAHFHEVDQFQIIVGGSGTIGRESVRPGAIHYADGYTVYGPIRTTDPHGISYLTLRAKPATYLNYMPESRQKRTDAGGGGGHFLCSVEFDTSVQGDSATFELIAESSRGARAYACRLSGAGVLGRELLPADQLGRGYAVVLSGAICDGERTLPAQSLIPFDDDARLIGLAASGSTTCTLAIVIFPERPAQN